jgi:hypothetical protein
MTCCLLSGENLMDLRLHLMQNLSSVKNSEAVEFVSETAVW